MGLLDTLISANQGDRQNLNEAVQGLFDVTRKKRVAGLVEGFITKYGPNATLEQFNEFTQGEPPSTKQLAAQTFTAYKSAFPAKKMERFKLGPGQREYGIDPSGKATEIMSVPPTQPKDPIKRVYDSEKRGYTFVPESTITANPDRYFESLEVLKEMKRTPPKTPEEIAAEDKRAIQLGVNKQKALIKAGLALPPKEKETSIEEKTSTIMEAYPGIDKGTAKKIAVGSLKVVTDPYTGSFGLVDVGTGTQKPLTMEQNASQKIPPATAADAKKPPTIWELSDLSTGPLSSGLSAYSTVGGMVGLPIAKKTEFARQYVTNAQNDLVRALSINPRFPVGEINRIRDEINIAPRFFDNPSALRERAKAINSYLKQRLKKELAASKNTMLPMDDRQAATSSSEDIKSFLKILGVPEENNATSAITKEDDALINKYLQKR